MDVGDVEFIIDGEFVVECDEIRINVLLEVVEIFFVSECDVLLFFGVDEFGCGCVGEFCG